jgi:hypothetical protein
LEQAVDTWQDIQVAVRQEDTTLLHGTARCGVALLGLRPGLDSDGFAIGRRNDPNEKARLVLLGQLPDVDCALRNLGCQTEMIPWRIAY